MKKITNEDVCVNVVTDLYWATRVATILDVNNDILKRQPATHRNIYNYTSMFVDVVIVMIEYSNFDNFNHAIDHGDIDLDHIEKDFDELTHEEREAEQQDFLDGCRTQCGAYLEVIHEELEKITYLVQDAKLRECFKLINKKWYQD